MRREFSTKTKLAAYERSKGICDICSMQILARAEYDHVLPDGMGGDTSLENCQCICAKCHRLKTSNEDIPRIAKTKRTKAKATGAWRKPLRRLQGRGFQKRTEMAERDMDT